MMSLPELLVLDVGHGNSAILRDTDSTIVIDCAPGATLLAALRQEGISEISAVLISHADKDHLAGIMELLTDEEIKIGKIYINPDATKKTDIWDDFRIAVKIARQKGDLVVQTSLTTSQSGEINVGEVYIEVLYPSPEVALSGPGGLDLDGRPISSNSMSAVIGLVHKGHRVVILPGDIDDTGFNNLLSTNSTLNSDVLVFPHHGGTPGSSSAYVFSSTVCSHIQPKLVIFSIDHKNFANPNDEIIKGVRTLVPSAHIVCTQLATKCVQQISLPNTHLTGLPAKGSINNRCCGGTIIISFDGANSTYLPQDRHQQFVQELAKNRGNPRCIAVDTAANVPNIR